MEKLNLTNIYKRLKAEVPTFWKQVRRVMITLGSIGGAIAALPEKYTLFLPANLSGMLIVAGAVGAGLATLTCGGHEKTGTEFPEH